jgi:GAF domain
MHAVGAADSRWIAGKYSRWPRFGGRVARMGVHSAPSLPLVVGDQVIGAINSYANARDAFGEHAVQLGSQFAGPAAVSVFNAQTLARAQDSGSCGSAEEAFDRLVHMSQTEYVKLRMVAERLVEEARRANARHREP